MPTAELDIVDTHCHLWNLWGHHFFAQDYLADVHSVPGVSASVYIECDMRYLPDGPAALRPVGEARFVVEQAAIAHGDSHQLAAGFVGMADMMLGDGIDAVLDALHAESGGRLRGIRARIGWDEDAEAGYHGRSDFPQFDMVPHPAFLAAAKRLETRGLSLDIWGFHPQLPGLGEVAARCPGLNFILDHLGGPLGVGRYARAHDRALADWRDSLRALAQLPNVFVKLSGIGVTRLALPIGAGRAMSVDQIAEVIRPYLETCVETMGPSRCLFGSNFSADRHVGSYATVVAAYRQALSGLARDDLQAVFGDTARSVYRLTDQPSAPIN